MEWQQFPWGPVVTGSLVIIGFICWLVRLEMRANGTAKDFTDHEKDQVEASKQAKIDEKERAASNKAVTDALHGDITMTNTRITVIEHQLTEIKATAVTRHDLKDLKVELTESINQVGDRTVAEVNRMVQVIAAAKDDKQPTRTTRAKAT